ncbi:MAG: flagellar basal body P-ring formation chaperone FlgA [Kiloniellales bacterium]
MRVLLLAALLLLAATAERPALAEAVALKSFALVEGDLVRLGDLFDGLGSKAETAVARAPAPGERVELSSRWLAALARGHGVDWRPASGFERVTLERASHTIDASRIEDVLREGLAARGLQGEADLQLDNPALQLVLPAEVEPSLQISGLAYDSTNGRFTARVVAPAQGATQAQAIVTGRAVLMTSLPVLQRQVAPGEVIRAQDIGWVSVRADRMTRNVIADASGLVGKSPRRPIALDQPVRSADLREPITVQKNSLVVIRLETARMILTAQGRALENGAAGAAIRVMNTKSNTVINAVVVDSGTVEVPAAGDLVTD